MSKKLLNLLLVIMMLAVLVPTTLAAPPAQEEGQDYVVVADDWLSKLADKYLGNPLAYPAIVEYTNQKHAEDASYAEITNPDLIEVGWKIYIPSAEEAAKIGEVVTAGPKTGGTLVAAMVAEPESMDPAQGSAQSTVGLTCNVYESLLQYGKDSLDVEPALAESWEVSDDGLTWTFHLRKGVKFHDGTPFNAEAAKFSVDRILGLDDNPYYEETGPFPLAPYFFWAVQETKAVDEYTLEFSLSEPFFLHYYLAFPILIMVSPTVVEQYGADFSLHPSGTGPFILEEWKRGQEVILKRNPDYWGGAPYLDKLIFRPITEEQVRYTELLAGGVDVAWNLPPDVVPQVKDNPDLIYHQTQLPHMWFVQLNTKAGPFSDVRVRHAVNYAINKEALINDVLNGMGVPLHSCVGSTLKWFNPNPKIKFEYDPEKAKELLAEAGYPDGFETIFWVTESGSGMQSPKAMGEVIQADLAAVGIRAKIETFEWTSFLQKVNEGLPDDVGMSEMSWFGMEPYNVPHLALTTEMISPAGFNTGYYSNPELDELLAKAPGTGDEEEFSEIFLKVQDICVEDAPWIFVDTEVQPAASVTKVKDFILHPASLFYFKKVWLDE
jgi:peptide/nickel transport system substrate-binding protein